MGAGVDLLRALRRAATIGPGFALLACIDFVEPDLPELGAPAVFEATIQLSDSGFAAIDARLAPGLDDKGYRRPVVDEAIRMLGRTIVPDSVQRNGTRRYTTRWSTDPSIVANPTIFRAPSMGGVVAPPPDFTWTGIRRLGTAEIGIEPGHDVELVVQSGAAGTASPAPDVRQWFLSLKGESSSFGLSADGTPPDTILVPARWIPDGDRIEVRLIFSQSAFLQPPPGDYLGLVTLDTRLYWTLGRARPRTPRPAQARGRPRPSTAPGGNR